MAFRPLIRTSYFLTGLGDSIPPRTIIRTIMRTVRMNAGSTLNNKVRSMVTNVIFMQVV